MSAAVLEAAGGIGREAESFLRQIPSLPQLTPQQEQQLARRCALEDPEAIRIMVSANLPLVVSVARHYAGRGVPLMDLIQEGSIGLIAAARKFDPSLGNRFSTYATKWISHFCARSVINYSSVIRVPHYTAQRMRRVLWAQSALRQQTGQEPELSQIAALCGITEEKTRQLLLLVPEVCSLDAPLNEEGDGQLQRLLADLLAPQPQEALVRRELQGTLDTLLSQLTPRQQQVMRLRYGLQDGVCYTLEQIGQQLQISRQRAGQLEHDAMEKLRALTAGQGLEDYLL